MKRICPATNIKTHLQEGRVSEQEGPAQVLTSKNASEVEQIAPSLAALQVGKSYERLDAFSGLEVAQRIIRARKEVDELFDELSLLRGPIFDILLDLFVSGLQGKDVSVSEAAIAGRCKPTTGLRHLDAMIEAGLVEKKADRLDNRRSSIFLTPKGVEVASKCIRAFAAA